MLPTLSIPEFTTVQPSTGKDIRFRPFLVREEKILLIALEDGEKETIIRAVLDLLDACIIDDIDVHGLPTFDVEYLFMQIRAKSVGEQIEMLLRHNSSDECKEKTKFNLNIDDIKIVGKVSDGKIQLSDEIGIKLKYPTFETERTVEKNANSLFSMIMENVEYVYDLENVYDDFTKEELEDWIGHLNKDQFDKILEFFSNAPKLSHVIEWECKKCGKKDYAVVEGLKGFFMLG